MQPSSLWVYDPQTKTYALLNGLYRCTVRHTAAREWLAVISIQGHGADAYSFDTQAEAQAGCEARVSESSQRVSDAEPHTLVKGEVAHGPPERPCGTRNMGV